MAPRDMSAEVVVLTREPIAGQVKTRLIPAIGAQAAADLHLAMVWETLERASRSGLPVRVSVSGSMEGPFVQSLHDAGYQTEAQATGDLGARMAHALQRPGRQIALGTDCVVFDPEWLLLAARSAHPVSIGPTEDGGYWTIAIDGDNHQLLPVLFSDVAWSTDTVFSTTRTRLAAFGVSMTRLPLAYDIDVPEDLHRLHTDARCGTGLNQVLSSISRTSP
jgi:rSAM/selenodomain-associated transferase 1